MNICKLSIIATLTYPCALFDMHFGRSLCFGRVTSFRKMK